MQSLPNLLIGVFVFILFAASALGVGTKGRRYRRSAPQLAFDRDRNMPNSSRFPDAADQLRTVERVSYGQQPLLRHQESQVFAAAELAVREAGVAWRVFAQVSLGEVLTCRDREGFNAINAKRVDFLIADAAFAPVAAIEYQGAGHHLGKAAARDAVKKEALRKAGIGYIEITHHDGPQDVRREISRLAFARTRAAAGSGRQATGGR